MHFAQLRTVTYIREPVYYREISCVKEYPGLHIYNTGLHGNTVYAREFPTLREFPIIRSVINHITQTHPISDDIDLSYRKFSRPDQEWQALYVNEPAPVPISWDRKCLRIDWPIFIINEDPEEDEENFDEKSRRGQSMIISDWAANCVEGFHEKTDSDVHLEDYLEDSKSPSSEHHYPQYDENSNLNNVSDIEAELYDQQPEAVPLFQTSECPGDAESSSESELPSSSHQVIDHLDTATAFDSLDLQLDDDEIFENNRGAVHGIELIMPGESEEAHRRACDPHDAAAHGHADDPCSQGAERSPPGCDDSEAHPGPEARETPAPGAGAAGDKGKKKAAAGGGTLRKSVQRRLREVGAGLWARVSRGARRGGAAVAVGGEA